ncbi:hypothetical protein WJX73_005756 [Symbiochloris irregularis]|uniref:Sec-independent protein translocase protein TatA n=1 Tax=Symbiochloris irregularis TaxID=706552 RepID=A0AAW1NMQ1_9CHLO
MALNGTGALKDCPARRCKCQSLGQRRQAGWQRRPARQVTTMGLFGLGIPELAIIAGVATLLFGPSKLPGLGKELGKTVKSFQGAAKEFETELKKASEEAKTLPEDDNKRQ